MNPATQRWAINPTQHCRNPGFTLIELMVVVAIIAILAAIAYPSYRGFVIRSNRSDAKVALMRTAQNLERRFTLNNSYAGATLGTAPATDVGSTSSPENFYTIALPTLTAATYTMSATAKGTQASDTSCATMTLSHIGVKTPAACW